MKKKILPIIAFVLAISTCMLIMAGCQSKENKSEHVTITYWSIYPIGDPYTVKHQAYINEFETANPNIKIDAYFEILTSLKLSFMITSTIFI